MLELRRHFSSIKVKLFLWFWLITICSVGITRVIITQLNENVIVLPAHEKDIRQLHIAKHLIEQMQLTKMAEILNQAHQRPLLKKAYRKVWLKLPDSNEVYQLSGRPDEKTREFIATTELDERQTWQLPKSKITGPIAIKLDDKEALLYVSSRSRMPRHLSSVFQHMPIWMKLITPLVVSIILSWLLARTLSRPLLEVADVARKFGEGELKLRLTSQTKRKDELGTVAVNFNEMADKIEENVHAHQRLLGDVSHELRSPLTRLQMALALAQTHAHDSEKLTQHMQRCELEVSRLDSMIADVLSLSRLENTLQPVEKSQCNITDLLTQLIDDASFIAQDKQINIIYEPIKTSPIFADSQLLASAIGNILGNAVKYSPEQSNIQVTLEQRNHQLSITISDQGHGVPEAAIEKLFEPFYRVADARDRTTGGTGLGLAIAKQAIKVHNGTISAQNNDSGGLSVTVQLPE